MTEPTPAAPRPDNVFTRTQFRKKRLFFRPFSSQSLLHTFLCFLVIGISLWALTLSPLKRLEHMVLDQFLRHRPQQPVSPSIAYIEISEDSLQALGRWPWARHYHAVLTHVLHHWGAKAIVFDILFSEPSGQDDEAMAEAFREASNVYLPVVLESQGNAVAWVHSIPKLEGFSKATGHINVTPDFDGVLRRIQPYLEAAGERHPHLALRVAYDALGQPVPPPDQLPFPRDLDGNLLVNWTGGWAKTFEHFSYLDVLKSFEAATNGRPPIIPTEKIKDKICLVGVTAMGLTDTKAVPLAPAYPALGVQANVLNSILTNRFITPAPLRLNVICLLALGFIASLSLIFLQPIPACIFNALLSTGWVAAAFHVFCRQGVWILAVYPIAMILILLFLSIVYLEIVGEKEAGRLFQLATKDGLTGLYVIRYVRALMNQVVEEMRRRNEPLCVLMIDIDHFKKVNDTYGHAAGDKVLKEVARIVQVSIRETDIAGRYGGEELIVLLPRTKLDVAITVAERIRSSIEQTSFSWKDGVIPTTVSIGVGIHRSEETVPDLMVTRADEALYRAKEGGRNQVCHTP